MNENLFGHNPTRMSFLRDQDTEWLQKLERSYHLWPYPLYYFKVVASKLVWLNIETISFHDSFTIIYNSDLSYVHTAPTGMSDSYYLKDRNCRKLIIAGECSYSVLMMVYNAQVVWLSYKQLRLKLLKT